MWVESLGENLEGAKFRDPKNVFLEDLEGDELGREVVQRLQTPATALAQLLAIRPDFQWNELQKKER